MRGRVLRRGFLFRSSALLGTGCVQRSPGRGADPAPRLLHPVVVASANGFPACTARVMEQLEAGRSVVDAVVAGVTLVEDDPNDHSVGLGGLPNASGEVELDAAVMDGESGLGGGVAALRRIRNAAKVALAVMRHTDHTLLVGAGANAFARERGIREEELLTEDAKEIWRQWMSTQTPGGTPLESVPHHTRQLFEITGTIHCSAIAPTGGVAAVTTTSGTAFKRPGRVGDSPLIGAGLFVDNDVGAAGSTGRGEAIMLTSGSHTVVEAMRQGQHPTDACLEACRRIVRGTRVPRLQRADGHPNFDVEFYALDRKGRYGGASLYPGGRFAIFDRGGNRTEELVPLFAKRGR